MNFKKLYRGIVKRRALITGLTGIVIGGFMLKPYIHPLKKLDNQTIEYSTNEYSRKDAMFIGLGFSLSLLSLSFLEHYSEKRKREIEDMIEEESKRKIKIKESEELSDRDIDYYLREYSD